MNIEVDGKNNEALYNQSEFQMPSSVYQTYVNGQLYNVVYLTEEQIQQMMPMQEMSYDQAQNNLYYYHPNQDGNGVSNGNLVESLNKESKNQPKKAKKRNTNQNFKIEKVKEDEKQQFFENPERVSSSSFQNNQNNQNNLNNQNIQNNQCN